MRRSDDDLIDDPELAPIADRLRAERPAPLPEFRGSLLEHLMERVPVPERGLPSRARARALVAAYGAAGVMLIAVAAVGLAGVGPFAA